MVSRRVDTILETIDVGLQKAGGASFGGDLDSCVRCQRRSPMPGSVWCDLCDPTDDTARRKFLEACFAACAQLAQTIWKFLCELVEWLAPLAARIQSARTKGELPRKGD